MDQFWEGNQFKLKGTPWFKVKVRLTDDLVPEAPTNAVILSLEFSRSSSATNVSDQEENCVRLAEQAVRELFRRWRQDPRRVLDD